MSSVSDNTPLLETMADDRARAESDPLGSGLQALDELDDIHVYVAVATWFGDQLDNGAGAGPHFLDVSNLVGFYRPPDLRATVQRLLRETSGQTQVALAYALRRALIWDQRFDAPDAYGDTIAAARKVIDDDLAQDLAEEREAQS